MRRTLIALWMTATLSVVCTATAGHAADNILADGYSGWSLWGDEDAYLVHGIDRSYVPPAASVTGSGDLEHVTFTADDGTEHWTADFQAPLGTTLLSGMTYRFAERYPFNPASSPGMSLTGSGGGCNDLTGEFTVHEAEYVDGAMVRFRVSFEHHCDRQDPAAYGEISWHADVAPRDPPPDVTPTDPVTSPVASPTSNTVMLYWDNPANGDWTQTTVRGMAGLEAPETPDGGFAVATTTRRTDDFAEFTAIPGASYSFGFFAFDDAGNVSDRTSVTVRGSRLTLTAPTRITIGTTALLRGRLVDTATGSGLQRSISIDERRAGSATWTTVHGSLSNPDGTWSAAFTPRQSTAYRVRYQGGFGEGNAHTGASAGPAGIRVAPRVALTASRTKVAPGSAVKLDVRVSPTKEGRQVVFQRWAAGSWRRIAVRTLDRESRTALRVSVGATSRYRVRISEDQTNAAATSRAVRITVA